MRVLFIAAEAVPFAKRGGLADVCGALPAAIAALGHDVRVVIPAYAHIEAALAEGGWGIRALDLTLRVPLAGTTLPAGVFETTLPGTMVPVWFVAERHLFDRPRIYGYDDDPYRFSFLSRAALDLAIAALGWRPDIVHAHDWHAAPAVFWLGTAGQHDDRYRDLPRLLTIHNLRHQGRAPRGILSYLGIDDDGSLPEEGSDEVNLLARGLVHATMINAVSPTYAREILTPEGGAGLDALLRHRQFDVHGILNGIDVHSWNPAADASLAASFTSETLDRRLANKAALQARLGLSQRQDVPIVAMVTRLDRQKGLDITGHVVHRLLNNEAGEAQFVMLGSGAPQYEEMFRHLADYHREKMSAVMRYENALAPLIYGGSDIFLMPSLYEPCGLGQMIAMRYASVPVVRGTGGLMDTVHDGVSGFTFHEFSSDAFWSALGRAIYIYRHDRRAWRAMQRYGMTHDFSWQTSARGYEQLYEWAVARTRGW